MIILILFLFFTQIDSASQHFWENRYKRFDRLNDAAMTNLNHKPDVLLWRYALMDSTIKAFCPKEAHHVLDIASGAGHYIWTSLELWPNAHIVGFDISPRMADTLKIRFYNYPNVDIYHADLRDPYFINNEKFDVILAMGCMEHMISDEELVNALNTFERSMTQGGIMLVSGRFDTVGVHYGPDNFIFKRLRSLELWKDLIAQTNLKLIDYVHSHPNGRQRHHHHDVLVLKRKQ